MGNPAKVRSFPPPAQAELPVWITSVGDVETFRSAGRIGAGLLTHLPGQSPDQLTEKIFEYRKAASEASQDGWSDHVVVVVHTFLGEDNETVRELVRPALSAYMRSSLCLITREVPGRVRAAPTTPGRTSTARWFGSGKRDGEEYERNQWLRLLRTHRLKSGGYGPGAAHPRTGRPDGELLGVHMDVRREATVKSCGVAVAMPQGQSWAPTSSNESQ
ncbi:LLM class flavin-dependent oxidoreductase [Streptomyces sp. NPDC046862]|uniref:LLM class flavin-dependent oxidoreductase n=1 Tax=Streptomyces sp. NPDC046862 TaxID=3154603 RepID=UPI003451633F